MLDDIFALICYIKSYSPEMIIYFSFEDRGLMSSLPLIADKWGFKLENIPEYLDLEIIIKEQTLFFSNEVYLFELK